MRCRHVVCVAVIVVERFVRPHTVETWIKQELGV